MAYQESSALEDLDGLARMALAALSDSAAEYLKAGEAAGYAEPDRPSAVPLAPTGLSRPQPPLEPGGMSTEELIRLVEADSDLHRKP